MPENSVLATLELVELNALTGLLPVLSCQVLDQVFHRPSYVESRLRQDRTLIQ